MGQMFPCCYIILLPWYYLSNPVRSIKVRFINIRITGECKTEFEFNIEIKSRFHISVRQRREQMYSSMEQGYFYPVGSSIKDQIYGHSPNHWRQFFGPNFDFYLSKPASYWTDMINNMFSGKLIH